MKVEETSNCKINARNGFVEIKVAEKDPLYKSMGQLVQIKLQRCRQQLFVTSGWLISHFKVKKTSNCKTNVRNGFLGMKIAGKDLLHMIIGQLVQKLNFTMPRMASDGGHFENCPEKLPSRFYKCVSFFLVLVDTLRSRN